MRCMESSLNGDRHGGTLPGVGSTQNSDWYG